MTSPALRIATTSYYLPSESKIGAGYVAHRLAQTMVGRGHSVTMFSPCRRPDDASYEHVMTPIEGSLRTFRWGAVVGRLDLSAFDVLHAHGDNHLRTRRSSPPVVRTLHGSCFAEAWHIKGAKERLRMVALGVTEVVGSLTATRTVAVSRDTTRYTRWVKTVIPNGVDIERFHPGQKASRPTVLFVGTYGQRKRGRLLMEVFAREVLPVLPDAQLWMVCSDAPDAANVEVLGRLEDDDLADGYRQAWVFCLPSSYEGFGVPYVEAMASGTAVIATPNPGAADILDGGRFGVLTSPERLGADLLGLLRNEQRRDAFAAAALVRSETYAWDHVATRYETEFRQAIASHRDRRRGRRRERFGGGSPS